MKYNILVSTTNTSGIGALYKYLTFVNENGEQEIYEATSLEEVDAKIEKMVNGNYRKKDLLVVSPVDFTLLADIVESKSSTETEELAGNDTQNGESENTETPTDGAQTGEQDQNVLDPPGE